MLYYLLGTICPYHAQKPIDQSTYEVCLMTEEEKVKKKRKIEFKGDQCPTEQIQEETGINVGKQQQL